MSNQIAPDFVVIDDDSVNNLLCVKMLKLVIPDCTIITFTSPEEGIEHLRNRTPTGNATTLFLDIDMPSLSGWETLDLLEAFPESQKQDLEICVLTSSINPADRRLAEHNALVKSFVTKPISKEKLKDLFPHLFS